MSDLCDVMLDAMGDASPADFHTPSTARPHCELRPPLAKQTSGRATGKLYLDAVNREHRAVSLCAEACLSKSLPVPYNFPSSAPCAGKTPAIPEAA